MVVDNEHVGLMTKNLNTATGYLPSGLFKVLNVQLVLKFNYFHKVRGESHPSQWCRYLFDEYLPVALAGAPRQDFDV